MDDPETTGVRSGGRDFPDDALRGESFDAMFASMPLGLMVLDEAGDVVRVNPASLRLAGRGPTGPLQGGPGNFLGCSQADRDPRGCGFGPDCPICPLRRGLDGVLSGQAQRGVEVPLELIRDGRPEPVWLRVNVEPLVFGDHRHVLLTLEDVTERRRTEEALSRSTSALARAQAVSHVGSWSWHIKTNRLEWSDEMYRIFGRTRDGFSGDLAEVIASSIHPDDRPAVERANESVARDKAASPLEYRVVWPDGTTRTVWAEAGDLLLDDEGNPELLTGIVQDITERSRAEGALLERERWLHDSQRAARIGSYSLDVVAGCWTSSDVLDEILGIDASAERTVASWGALVHPDERQEMLDYFADHVLTGRRPFDKEYRIVRAADGQERWVWGLGRLTFADDGTPTGMIGTIQDVSERKRTAEALRASEERLLQSQKMEAIGQLAGGLAHDLNNLLTPIIGCSELMLDSLAASDDQREDLREILMAAERAATLTRQLLAFSRRQPLRPRLLDVNEVVNGMSTLLRRLLGEDVALHTDLEPVLWAAEVDPAQLEQVIMNLAVNARDAMPDGGRLTITTANKDLDDAFAASHPSVAPGRHVMITMSDTGHGMDETIRSRVFEPFFTTKEQGRGTGLGLSTVYGIVKQSQGTVWVSSAPGEGSTFSIFLPAADGVAAPLGRKARGTTAPPKGTETVLVVEDEPSVRSLVARVLRRHGYKVYEAGAASDALALLTDPPHIDLLLTDVVLPGMNGRELADTVEQAAPEVKVLFMSGYTRDAAVLSGRLGPDIPLLEKPFTPDALARHVREVLDQAP